MISFIYRDIAMKLYMTNKLEAHVKNQLYILGSGVL